MAAFDLNELVMTVSTDVDVPLPCSGGGKSFYDLSSETRESGDGDSGTEYKEKPSAINLDVEPPMALPMLSAVLGTKPRKSRIPVRTAKCTNSRSISVDCRTNVIQSNESDPANESALDRITARAHITTAATEEHQIIILEAPEQFRSMTKFNSRIADQQTVVDDDGSDIEKCYPACTLLEDYTTALGAEVTEVNHHDGHDNEQPDADGIGTTSICIKSDDAMYQCREKSSNNGAYTIAEGAVEVLPQGLAIAAEDVSISTAISNLVPKKMTSQDEDVLASNCTKDKLLLSSVGMLSDNCEDNNRSKIKTLEVVEEMEKTALHLMDPDLCNAPRARVNLIREKANNNIINADRPVNTTKTQQQPVLGVISLLRQAEQDMALQKHHSASCANNEINDLTDNVQSNDLTPYKADDANNQMSACYEVKCIKQRMYALGCNIDSYESLTENEMSLFTTLNNNGENDIVNVRTQACERTTCASNNKSDSNCLEETDVIACVTCGNTFNNIKLTVTDTANNSSECALNDNFRNLMDLYVIEEECEIKNNYEFTFENVMTVDEQNCHTTMEILTNPELLLVHNADNSNYNSVPLNHNELEFTNSICMDGYDNPSLGAQNDNLIDFVSIDNCTITKELLHEYNSSNSNSNDLLHLFKIDNGDEPSSDSVGINNNNSSANNDDESLRNGNNCAVGGGLDGGTSAAVRCGNKVESDPFKDDGNVAAADDSFADAVVITTVGTNAEDSNRWVRECDGNSPAVISSASVLSLSVVESIHIGAVECAVPPPPPPPLTSTSPPPSSTSGCSSSGGSRRSTDAWISRPRPNDVPVQDDHTTVSTATRSSCWTTSTSAGQPRVPKPPQSFAFRNGRLVFDTVVQTISDNNGDCDETPGILNLIHKCAARIDNTHQEHQLTNFNSTQSSANLLLSSKDLNKRPTDGRLKELGEKLKKAGLTDETNQQQYRYIKYSSDNNQNLLSNVFDYPSADSASVNTSCCEFDVSRIGAYSGGFGDDGHFFEVYDELDDEEPDDLSLVPATTTTMPTTAGEMDTIDRSKQHNPDHENLKSLLKKPGRTKDRVKKGVVFNEKKNEFFDADYIILIREDCDYDEEEDDGVCTCNQQHEMVRLTCCEPNCNCGYSDGGPAATPQSPKFAPPLEFVDAVTLSPPEGYKDMGLEEQQLIALQQLARRGQLTAACGTTVCRECSVTHEVEDGEGSEEEASDNETTERMDHSQQTTPTTPPAEDDEEMTCSHSEHHHHHHHHHHSITPVSTTDQQQSISTLTSTTTTTTGSGNFTSNSHPSNSNSAGAAATGTCGSPISGILKGGRLWKQQSGDVTTSISSPPISGGNTANINNANSSAASAANAKAVAAATQSDSSITSDDEAGGTNGRRSVRFIDSSDSFPAHRESCDGASSEGRQQKDEGKHRDDCNNTLMDSTTELMLTFKLPNHHLQISNNSLKPNSAMRQLFPCTKVDDTNSPYLVTSEALRAFDEAKRSKLQQILQDSNNTSSSSDTDSIKRAIERNTLRRSLIKYEPKQKKAQLKTDSNSLVERIKQLTCDIDEDVVDPSINNVGQFDGDEIQQQTRSSPPGEEARTSPEANNLVVKAGQGLDKSFSPSSSSTASSNSSVSSTYKKITDLFGKTKEKPDIQNNIIETSKPPDLCNSQQHNEYIEQSQHYVALAKANSTNEARKQFLSTLAPLTACVGGIAASEDYYYHLKNQTAGERVSIASSVGTEYSLEDIDEGLKKADEDDTKRIAPDVLVGTPSASDSADELAMFVQQDASRIERIKKKYQPGSDDEDEHDDYGFNRRPSVRGIKPRFGSTTEILQQIQNQMQPPVSVSQPTAQLQTQVVATATAPAAETPPRHPVTAAATAWPYYSETTSLCAASCVDSGNKNRNNVNQGTPVSNNYSQQPQYITTDDTTKRNYAHFRPTNVIDENMYQNCANQRCTQQQISYRPNVNIYAPTIKIGGDYYHQTTVSVPASAIVTPRRNSSPSGSGGRPQSPPPQDISKSHYQTMMYIPYNHIDAYQQPQAPHSPNFYNVDGYNRISNQNQINKRYIDPTTASASVYQMRLDEPHYATKAGVTLQQQPAHRALVLGRSESPLSVQYSNARSTQTGGGVTTTTMATSNMQQQPQQTHLDYTRAGYYTTSRYHRPVSGSVSSVSSEPAYVTKMNRYSFPTSVAPPQTPPISSAGLQQQQIVNGYIYTGGSKNTSMPNSPTKQQGHRFIERGVPEGAASVSPQDSNASASQSASTMTSPIISPHQHPPPTNTQTAVDIAALNNVNTGGAPIPGTKPLFYAMNV